MIDFIKDADCTKETPVKLGVPDAPIYGKGIKLKPRVDGRTDSEHFKKIYLPELLPLEEYDLIVVLISGGKDSVACYLKLLELGVPKERIEFWHHDIDGGHPSRRMDWKCTQNYVKALADAPVEEIEEIVRPCGLGKSKARDISACMKILRDEYNGKVPDDFDKLLKLPGVGRKSANLIMGDVFGKPAIVTDTHCIRLCNRIGLVDKMKDPKKVEMALWKIIPPEEGNSFCHRLVNHGREVCTARTKPYCDKCCLQDICKKVDVK